MRLMTWNIEHMNRWWEGGRNPNMRNRIEGVDSVKNLAQRVGNVISEIKPDIIAIQEGAGFSEMTDFFDRFVEGDNWKIIRGSGGAQALVTVANLDTVKDIKLGQEIAGEIDLNSPYDADVDANLAIEEVSFTRKPLVTDIEFNGHEFVVINCHLKSKYVNGGESLFRNGGSDRLEFYRKALKARRRISAEAFRIREFLDSMLENYYDENIIIAGDLNDGPGADFFERNFLTHSVVDRVFGSIFNVQNQFKNVLLHEDIKDHTAEFHDFVEGTDKKLILDHIGVSPAIVKKWKCPGRVAVAEYEGQTQNRMRGRDKLPSDHRPVVVDIEIT